MYPPSTWRPWGRHEECTALRDVSLTIDPENEGEILAVLGPSGCGKTTLLRVLVGLVTPTYGAVYINGALAPRKPKEREMSMLFQSSPRISHKTVAANIEFWLRVRTKLNKDERTALVRKAAERVGIPHLLHKHPKHLSGGELRRMAVAATILVPQVSTVLLDEPFSALDANQRNESRMLVRELLKETGRTAVYVTHDQEEAQAIADRIVVMRDGSIEQIGGTYVDVYRNPRTQFVAEFTGGCNILPVHFVSKAPRNVSTVGIRSEHVALHKASGNGIPATISDVRFGSRSAQITLRVRDYKIVAETKNETWAIGETCWITFEKYFAFDADGKTVCQTQT